MAADLNAAETEAIARPNPGLEFFLWPKAFVHAAQAVVDKVFEEGNLINAYRSLTKWNDVQVTQLVKPAIRIEIRGSRLFWMLDNASVAVRGRRTSQECEESFENRISGPLAVRINVVQPDPFDNPIYGAKVESNNLTFSSSSRIGSGNSVNINIGNGYFTEFESFDLNSGIRKRTFSPVCINASNDYSSAKRSRTVSTFSSGHGSGDDLGETIIRSLRKAVLECLNDRLPDHSFPIGCSCDWMFNFSGLVWPRFQNGCLASAHLGAFHDSFEEPTAMPVQALPFPQPQNPGRMLTIFISNYVFNTIGYCLYESGILNYVLTQDDLIAETTQDNVAFDASRMARCLSDCFPDFSVKYPGASVKLDMGSIEPPTATFSGQHLKVSLRGSALFQADLPDGSVVTFLTTEVIMEASVLLRVNMEKLMGTVTSILPSSITIVENAVGSLSRDVLKETFDLIATQFLMRKFQETMDNGIPLPRPLLSKAEELENPVLSMADDLLRIDTDLKFQA